MDLITHAMAGAATGLAFDRPVAGAVAAILPDLALLAIRRRAVPTGAYNVTHSLYGWLASTVAVCAFGADWRTLAAFFFAYLSHLILDIPTHGPAWAPPLLWPNMRRFSGGDEWEWFNKSWFNGLQLSLFWINAWLLLSLYRIGHQS